MAKSENTSHGGKREKSGRKPVEDKKVALCVYIPQSRIDALGDEYIKNAVVIFIEKEFKKKKP